MTDLEFHEYFMRLALAEADSAAAHGEVPTGCVIIRRPADIASVEPESVEILGRSANKTEELKDPTAHAEIRAIKAATEIIGDFRLTDTILYVTKEPCAMCAGAIVLARIPLVVYGLTDPKRGGQSVFGILNHPSLIHRAEITEGILYDDCRERIQAFFRARRQE